MDGIHLFLDKIDDKSKKSYRIYLQRNVHIKRPSAHIKKPKKL